MRLGVAFAKQRTPLAQVTYTRISVCAMLDALVAKGASWGTRHLQYRSALVWAFDPVL